MKKASLILFACLFAISSNSFAHNVELPAPEGSGVTITSVIFDYEMISYENGKVDCKGTYDITVSVPDEAERVIFHRNHARGSQYAIDKIFTKSEWLIEDNSVQITSNGKDFPYDTKFMVQTYFSDGTYAMSDLFSLKDYVSPEDLTILEQTTDVEDISTAPLYIDLHNGILSIKTQEAAHLVVCNMQGRQIYSNIIHDLAEIDLMDVRGSFVVLRCITPDATITKKLYIAN